ncbi:YceI family protein [Alcaligenes sp. SDU_A2]|uniref:YceI family protein n=1 Tax=Alcaligenes sp. SDU_A2 TaxID=3136634 RepID=UPI002C59B848|nr:YceI family protein [Alcaligenes sp.]HRL26800.1 YceI family protein [Alcaligenes sp.]
MFKMSFIALSAALAMGSAAQAAPVTYQVEPSHTFVRFSYKHLGLSTQLHRFDTIQGTVVLDPQAKTGKIDMTVDTRSVDTGFPVFDEHIQRPDHFDTAKYPTATFTSSDIVFDGDKPVAAKGDLTIKGITKPVTLTIDSFLSMPKHPMLGKPALGADAQTQIKRSDFNMGANVPYVGDDVTISIALEAIQQ